jgi:hypothetical protein
MTSAGASASRFGTRTVRPVDTPETVTDAVRLLEREGFSADFTVDDSGVHCTVCDAQHAPAELRISRRFRFEGPTDPADEAIVLGVRCPTCGARGIVVSAYGPDADDQLLALIERLPDD